MKMYEEGVILVQARKYNIRPTPLTEGLELGPGMAASMVKKAFCSH